MTITLDDLHEWVMFEADNFSLELIESAIKYRRNTLNSGLTQIPNPTDDFKVGDTVRWNSTTRPKYLAGHTGTVKKINDKTVLISTERNPALRRYSGTRVRAFKSTLEKVES